MKIIALEEHFILPQIRAAWEKAQPEIKAMFARGDQTTQRLEDLAEGRIEQMDRLGIAIQVLSLTTPGVQISSPDEAVVFARQSNDAAAKAVAMRPDRF